MARLILVSRLVVAAEALALATGTDDDAAIAADLTAMLRAGGGVALRSSWVGRLGDHWVKMLLGRVADIFCERRVQILKTNAGGS